MYISAVYYTCVRHYNDPLKLFKPENTREFVHYSDNGRMQSYFLTDGLWESVCKEAGQMKTRA